jgi:hypothetical protein
VALRSLSLCSGAGGLELGIELAVPGTRTVCGRISEPSMASRGVDAWILSLRDTPASHSAKPVADVAKRIRDTCGPTFIELSRRFTLPSSFWRTCQATLGLGLDESSEISAHQATELRRLSSQRRKWAQATNGNGCSFWASPNARDSDNWKTPHGAGGVEFAKQANHWATPRLRNERQRSGRDMEFGDCLGEQIMNWPTPRSEDSESSGRRQGREVDDTLTAACRSFPPVQANLSDGPKPSSDTLSSRRLWPTPAAQDDNKSPEAHKAMKQRMKGGPRNTVTSLQVAMRLPDEKKRLNPLFVRWLMSWPLWEPLDDIGSERLETAWSHCKRRMRSAYLRLVCSAEMSEVA